MGLDNERQLAAGPNTQIHAESHACELAPGSEGKFYQLLLPFHMGNLLPLENLNFRVHPGLGLGSQRVRGIRQWQSALSCGH